jgi:hypothetical protein
MHHALHELREAREELRTAAHEFGGHRKKALKAVDAAIHQMRLGLEKVGDPFRGVVIGRDAYRGFPHHPHIHRAIRELKHAREELREARHNFGGHREQALRDVNYAIDQLELALRHARK